jgi:hypothetical protein
MGEAQRPIGAGTLGKQVAAHPTFGPRLGVGPRGGFGLKVIQPPAPLAVLRAGRHPEGGALLAVRDLA